MQFDLVLIMQPNPFYSFPNQGCNCSAVVDPEIRDAGKMYMKIRRRDVDVRRLARKMKSLITNWLIGHHQIIIKQLESFRKSGWNPINY